MCSVVDKLLNAHTHPYTLTYSTRSELFELRRIFRKCSLRCLHGIHDIHDILTFCDNKIEISFFSQYFLCLLPCFSITAIYVYFSLRLISSATTGRLSVLFSSAIANHLRSIGWFWFDRVGFFFLLLLCSSTLVFASAHFLRLWGFLFVLKLHDGWWFINNVLPVCLVCIFLFFSNVTRCIGIT